MSGKIVYNKRYVFKARKRKQETKPKKLRKKKQKKVIFFHGGTYEYFNCWSRKSRRSSY